MIFFRHWSVKTKLFLLLGYFVSGLSIFAMFTFYALWEIQSQDTLKQNALQTSELLSKISLSDRYLTEAYVVAQQLTMETQKEDRQRLIARGHALQEEYEARSASWNKSLPQDPVAKELMGAAYEAAMNFFTLRDTKFLPLILQGEREKARLFVHEMFDAAYKKSQMFFDESVQFALRKDEVDRRDIKEQVATETMWLLKIGIGVLVIVLLSGWRLVSDIVGPLRQLMDTLQTAANEKSGGERSQAVGWSDLFGRLALFGGVSDASIRSGKK